MEIPSNISGFSVIPVLYNSSTTHYLYARPHASSKSDSRKVLPEGRTLFLVNLPPDTTDRELVLFFKHSGTVEKVIFDFDVKEPQNEDTDSEEEDESMDEADDGTEEKPKKRRKTQKDKPMAPALIHLPTTPCRRLRKTGSSAYVIFLDSSSLERALASTSKRRTWPTSSEEPSGLAHYRALYDSLRPRWMPCVPSPTLLLKCTSTNKQRRNRNQNIARGRQSSTQMVLPLSREEVHTEKRLVVVWL
jgi:ribosomal RNA-processing protein 7